MSRKIALLILVLLTSVLFVQSASARPFADIYVECGLGALIAPNTPVVAVITNITWDLGTTAISSDISSPENCKGGQQEVAAFIYDAYESLETDLASGEGTYLDLLVVLAEYDYQGGEGFVDTLRIGFAGLVAHPGYTTMSRFEKAEALYDLVYQGTENAS